MDRHGSNDFPEINMTGKEIRDILDRYRTVAVVGLSDKPEKDSYRVAKYLKDHGYRIIPVNPLIKEILGEKSYPDLKSVPLKVDIVNIFRRPEAIPGIVDDAVEIGAKVVWMQDGLVHNKAAGKARRAGLEVVQSKCIMRQHYKTT
jgi:predicted CoA-binding protein